MFLRLCIYFRWLVCRIICSCQPHLVRLSATIVITSFSSAQRHYKLGNVVWDAVKILIPTLMLSTFVFTGIVSQLDKSLSSKLFAVLVAYMAIRMVISTKIQIKNTKKLTPLSSVIGGVLIGIVSSIAGIGGGGFIVPFLNSRGVDIKKAIGSSAVCGMLLGLSGALSFMRSGWGVTEMPEYSLGYVYLPAVLGITITSFFTSKIGATTTSKLPVPTLKRYFAIMLCVIALNMLFK